MTARMVAAATAAISLASALAGCAPEGGARGAGGVDAASLLVSRCTVCHGMERIDAAHHDRAGWVATIGRMRGHGAQLSDAEAGAVVDYLTSRQLPSPATPATAGP